MNQTRLNNKEKYKEFILKVPIFYQSWWLDIVCQHGDWDVCLVFSKNGRMLGVLPYYLVSFLGFKVIRTPPFTPYLGVWLDYSNCSSKNVNIYSFENDIIGSLISEIPKVDWYHQIHPEQLTNWLPFYWKGFRQSTRYTFIFENLDENYIWGKMKDKTRNLIRKAKASGITVSSENELDDFLQLQNKTYLRRGKSTNLDSDVFSKLHYEIQQKKQGCIFFAKDSFGNKCAALYLIWDFQTAYCWQLGVDAELSKNGAVQLLIWHSIQAASKIVRRYNFEGSMLPHIEPVFRAFGADRKPVFRIWKSKGFFGKLAEICLFKY